MQIKVEIFEITPGVGFYSELNTALIATASLGHSASLLVDGKAKFNSGDYVTIEGTHLSIRLRLPLVGPVEAALVGKLPDIIEIRIAEGRHEEKVYTHTATGFRSYLSSVYQPLVVNYYENTVEAVKTKFGSDRTTWPDAWQMGWLIRNAASHNDKIHFRSTNQQGVTWRGLVLNYGDQGTQVLNNLISGADLIQLMIDMEDALVGLLPTSTSFEPIPEMGSGSGGFNYVYIPND